MNTDQSVLVGISESLSHSCVHVFLLTCHVTYINILLHMTALKTIASKANVSILTC